MDKKGGHQLVVAIDLGTTYSSYAFSFRHEFQADPLKIHSNERSFFYRRARLAQKIPTCLLLDANKELDSFGFEAEYKYSDIVMDDEQNDYFFFDCFTMQLHNSKNITSGMMLKDIKGQPVPAIDIFAMFIKALVILITDQLDKQGFQINIYAIQWVLTVPAICTDAAKQFMRNSAVKAGISSDSLIVALEPDVVAIFCEYHLARKLYGPEKDITMIQPGAKYMVIDLGGGTADITVHEKLANGQLKQLCRATGNDCGGTSVDGRFFQMLVKIFGGPLMKEIKEDDQWAYMDLFREFEIVKKTLTPTKYSKVNITIPYVSLDKKCKIVLGTDLPDVIRYSTYSNLITVRGDKMRVDASLMQSLFEPTIDRIISMIQDILLKKVASGVSQLFLVGEFSECMLIQYAINRSFNEKTVIIPEKAEFYISKGAVLFGHMPEYGQTLFETQYNRMKTKASQLLVAALDFGTSYSGYAFSMRHEFQEDPLKIHANQAWNSGEKALLSLKTPTCLLLNSNMELDSFGYEAENKYTDIVMDEEQDNYYYFHRFKMKLHNNKNITSEMMLEDITGKLVPAIDVFALSIKALITHLTDTLDTQGTGMDKSDIQWVLTVPAIWTDAAKQFMRKSAVRAGIPDNRLKIALEPEAASIFCQHLPTKKLHGAEDGFTMTEPRSKYMVIDLGGGTADITVHEKLVNGQLKELCRATGNDCGGTSVDGRFFQMLVRIFGGPLMKKIKEEDPSAYLDLFREFETVKRTITPTKDSKVNITIPFASLDAKCKTVLGEDLPNVINSSTLSNQITVRGDKIRVDPNLMKSLFKPTVDNIVSLIKDIFENQAASEVSQLLLVGGFSECKLIQDAMRTNFKDKAVIFPDEAGLSVLKGAVLFGHRPEYVRSRVMRFSYGEEITTVFDKKYLDESKMPPRCRNFFSKVVEKDQEVKLGQKFTDCFTTTIPMQESMRFKMFVSTEKSPMYTDESCCTYLGSAVITFPKPTEEERAVQAEYIFGDTEINMTAVDVTTGTKITASFDL